MPKQNQYLTDEELAEAAALTNQLPSADTNGDEIDQEVDALMDEIPQFDYEDSPDFSEELLFSWVVPERVFRPRLSKDYVRNLVLLLILIGLILVFTSQFYLFVVVLALVFLNYTLVNVPPRKVRHSLTNYGIYTHDRFYSWLNRGQRFWFEPNGSETQVIIETRNFPYRLIMLVGPEENKKALIEVLSHYLTQQKPAPTKIDKIIAWWKEKFPME